MENIKMDEFLNYKFLSGVKYSPNSQYACFVVHKTDVEENKYLSNLWIYSEKDKKYFQLTALNSESSFNWMDDSENILFKTVRNEKDKKKKEEGEEFTKFYRINIHGGEAIEEFCIDRNVGQIKCVDENTYIFTSTYNNNKRDLNSLEKEEKAKELKDRKEEKDYEVLDEIPFWSNGQGFTNGNRSRLYIYRKVENSIEAITEEYMDVESFDFNSNKTKIVFLGSSYKNKMPLKNNIYFYDIITKKIEQVNIEEEFIYSYVNFFDDETLICTGSDMKKYGVNENHKFYTLNIKTQEKKCITPELDVALHSSVGSDCRYGGGEGIKKYGEHIYFVTTEDYNSYLNKIDINGKIERIIYKDGSVDSYDVSNDKAIFIGLRGLRLQELYKVNNLEEIQITDFNEWIQNEKNIAPLEKITIKRENREVDGWIIKPTNFDANKKYPAILDIHGGPKTAYGEGFFHEMQYWANEGYFVFFCNPVGSDGKGNEFADIRGKYGTIDYDDIMKFTDVVLEKYPFIDPKRIGVTGGSYGGFMTNWIIGHTDRFAAAASQRSISNWISKCCTTDIGFFFVPDQIDANPWDNVEKLWEHSPLKYADKVVTPTLFIHSEEDYRCWLTEGIQMFTALKYHNVESRLCMFRGENHELSRSGKPKHRIRRLKEITEWFNHYLK